MTIKFLPIPTEHAERYWSGLLDENNQPPEVVISDGSGNPCRHCLTEIENGKEMLILAYRPEEKINPYAEVGPIFLCASRCIQHPTTIELPHMFKNWESLLVRGYSQEGRIVYGTGSIIEITNIESRASAIFQDNDVQYIHLRSSSNNCYQCRIERSSA